MSWVVSLLPVVALVWALAVGGDGTASGFSSPPTIEECVDSWNAPDNAAARTGVPVGYGEAVVVTGSFEAGDFCSITILESADGRCLRYERITRFLWEPHPPPEWSVRMSGIACRSVTAPAPHRSAHGVLGGDGTIRRYR